MINHDIKAMNAMSTAKSNKNKSRSAGNVTNDPISLLDIYKSAEQRLQDKSHLAE